MMGSQALLILATWRAAACWKPGTAMASLSKFTLLSSARWSGQPKSIYVPMRFISDLLANVWRKCFRLCTNRRMPEICRFYGIIIQIYYGDHPPAHFHALYGEDAFERAAAFQPPGKIAPLE